MWTYYPPVKLAILASALLIVSVAQKASGKDLDIVDTAVAAGQFKTLAAALNAADLVGALKGEGPFTVFAPTDEAFAKLPASTVEMLLKPENKETLAAILTYHVVAGSVTSKQVVSLSNAKTLNGQRVDINFDRLQVSIDKAIVVQADIKCSNGIIHVIDSVLMPSTQTLPTVAAETGFSTLVAALKAAGLAEALSGEGPFTVFAPTDEAFAKLPSGTVESLLKPENKSKLVAILQYHVVPGRVYSEDALAAKSANTLEGSPIRIVSNKGGAMINASRLTETDIDASNGVIHVIDEVLMPPSNAVDASKVLRDAISQGAPLYNAGHHAACADIYQATLQSLMSTEFAGSSSTLTHHMSNVLANAERTHSSTQRAWTLRRGMDQAYALLQTRD